MSKWELQHSATLFSWTRPPPPRGSPASRPRPPILPDCTNPESWDSRIPDDSSIIFSWCSSSIRRLNTSFSYTIMLVRFHKYFPSPKLWSVRPEALPLSCLSRTVWKGPSYQDNPRSKYVSTLSCTYLVKESQVFRPGLPVDALDRLGRPVEHGRLDLIAESADQQADLITGGWHDWKRKCGLISFFWQC